MPKSFRDTHNKWLASEEEKVRKKQCSTCSNEELKEIVDAHLDALAEGRTKITLRYVYDNLLTVKFKTLPAYATVRSHCRRCLKRDALTGKNLDDTEGTNEQETT